METPKPGLLGPVNEPSESEMLREIQTRKQSMGKWRGKTPTGKILPGGRRRKTHRAKKAGRRKSRRVLPW